MKTITLFALLACLLSGIPGLPAYAAPGAPTNLRCEYTANPVGLDVVAPRLSWEVNDKAQDAVQAAYQIIVASTPDPQKASGADLLWDTGKTASDQSIHVAYQGKPLASRQRCYWTVRTWDKAGKESSWAKPACWEMGLLKADDWKAQWIARDASAGNPLLDVRLGSWVWAADAVGEKKHCYIRGKFLVAPEAKSAMGTMWITADDRFTVYINGQKAGEGAGWERLVRLDVGHLIVPGKNIIAVEAYNEVGGCGVIYGLGVAPDKGAPLLTRTGDNNVASAEAPEGWKTLEFDDSKWAKAKQIAKYGDQPWGRIADREYERSVNLRKEFDLDKKPVRARAYVAGLGLYELHVNGERVADEFFTPGWTRYPNRIQYRTYDVTDLLKKGANAVGVVLGNGWWGQGMASPWKDGPMRAIVQLETQNADGSVERSIITDNSWQSAHSGIVADSFYDGEAYDATQEPKGWDSAGFAPKEKWSGTLVVPPTAARLVAQAGPPIKVSHEHTAVAITEPAPGKFVYDFGQNASGVCRLKVKGPRGTKVTIHFAEILNPDGTMYTENYRSAKATDTYTLSGDGTEVWMPTFTYRGFRYAEISGYPGKPGKDALVAVRFNSEPTVSGSFECSEPLLNQIQSNIQWGQRSNMHSVPTDCPQRDERLGWTGDAQAFAPTACWNMDMASFFSKWLYDLMDSQGTNGAITDVAPNVSTLPAKPGWGDVITVVPWQLYRFYGDTRIVEESYAAMQAWVKYMEDNAPNNLYEREGYGDWVAVVDSPKKQIGAAYYYYSTKLLAQMARVLGKTADAERYEQRVAAIGEAFNAAYLDKNTNAYPSNTQTANLLPLAFGIVPADRRPAVFDNIVKDVVQRDYHLSTGFLGTPCLMPMLTANGRHDVAWKLATQRSYPSWGHMVEKGGTTIWERWNSDDYRNLGPGMNSFNHFAFGVVGEWYYDALAGINPEAPGFKRITIRPLPTEGLTWAKASYHSMYGMIVSDWKRSGDTFTLKVRIPANTTAKVWVPANPGDDIEAKGFKGTAPSVETLPGIGAKAAGFDVGAGEYTFTVRPAASH